MKKFSCVALNLALALTLTTAFCTEGYASGAGAGAGAGAHATPVAATYMVDLEDINEYLKKDYKNIQKESLRSYHLNSKGFICLIREGLEFSHKESFDSVVYSLFSCITDMLQGEGGFERAGKFVNTRIGTRTLIEAVIERVEDGSSLEEIINKTRGAYYSAELRGKILNDVADRALELESQYRWVSFEKHVEVKKALIELVQSYPKYKERTLDGWGVPLKNILLEPTDPTLKMIYNIRNVEARYHLNREFSEKYKKEIRVNNHIKKLKEDKQEEFFELSKGHSNYNVLMKEKNQAEFLENWFSSVLKVKHIIDNEYYSISGKHEYLNSFLFQIVGLFFEELRGIRHDPLALRILGDVNQAIRLEDYSPHVSQTSTPPSLTPKDYITGVLKDALSRIPQLRDVAMTKPVNLGELEGVLFDTPYLKNQRMAYVLAQPHEDGLVEALCPAEGFSLNGAGISKEDAQSLTVAGFYTGLLNHVPSNENDAFVTELYSSLYSPYIKTNGQNSAKVAFLSLLERAGGAVSFDTLQRLIAQDGTAHGVSADASLAVTELDAIELMADSLGFAARHEKVWGGAHKADLEQTALAALSGKATAQGFTVNLNRKANQKEFERIVNILDKTIRNMGDTVSVDSLKAHVLGDASGDESDQKLTSHQRNLLAVAVYKLGQINGWDNAKVLEEIAGALSIEESDDDSDMSVGGSAGTASTPHKQKEALGILRQVGRTFRYDPLKAFAAGADEGSR